MTEHLSIELLIATRVCFVQSGMSESKSDIVEIQDVAIEDMKTILDFIYGVLEAGGTLTRSSACIHCSCNRTASGCRYPLSYDEWPGVENS